ncbi:MAG: hypothetical protein IPL41_06315 [Micropruina sp.]|nr:hypothetical protein [Micropruina sp.]
MPEEKSFGGVGLSEAIQHLRGELAGAMAQAPKTGLRFQPGPIELSLQVAVTNNFGGRAGIKWWVIEAGAEASRDVLHTQALRLSLIPVFLDENGEVRDVLISGGEESSAQTHSVDLAEGAAE